MKKSTDCVHSEYMFSKEIKSKKHLIKNILADNLLNVLLRYSTVSSSESC